MTMLPLLPRLVFLVVGPAVDVKLFAMQSGMFGRSFAVRFAPATLLATAGDGHRFDAARWKRETENIVLLLVGISVALIVLGGEYTCHVKPGLLVWLTASAVVLIGLAVLAMAGDIRRGRPESNRVTTGTTTTGTGTAAVLPGCAAGAGDRADLRQAPADRRRCPHPVDQHRRFGLGDGLPPLPPGPGTEVLPDVVMRAANDKAHLLDGRTITVTTFVLHEPAGPDLGRGGDHLLRGRRPAGPDPSAGPRATEVAVAGQHLGACGRVVDSGAAGSHQGAGPDTAIMQTSSTHRPTLRPAESSSALPAPRIPLQ